MNNLEKQMLSILIDLKENYNAVALKTEFEAEGAKIYEAVRLKELSIKAGLDLTIKIGGCEAIKDLHDTKMIGAENIVAPMIESSYAMQKFINATRNVFDESELSETNLFINIETITGIDKIDDIFSNPHFKCIDGVILGRDDLIHSMNLSIEQINSQKVLDIANIIATKLKQSNKQFIIGGSISSDVVAFLDNLSKNYLSKFETRKVVFDYLDNNKDVNIAISKAIEFERLWLLNQCNVCEEFLSKYKKRLNILQSRVI